MQETQETAERGVSQPVAAAPPSSSRAPRREQNAAVSEAAVLYELPMEGWPAEDGGLLPAGCEAKGEDRWGAGAITDAGVSCGCSPHQPSSSRASRELWLRGVPPSSVARALSLPPPGPCPNRVSFPASPDLQAGGLGLCGAVRTKAWLTTA